MLGSIPRVIQGAARFGGAAAFLLAITACGVTTDSLGENPSTEPPPEPPRAPPFPLVGPATYRNAFQEVLGKTDGEIHLEIEQTFAQLFFGESDQRIYEPVAADQALIWDTFHDDARTEGLGYAMMFAVQLDKRPIFDRLWNYAKAELAYPDGHAYEGYFESKCATTEAMVWDPCPDPFGHQQFVMALILAHNRWGALPDSLDYATDAKALISAMRGAVDGAPGPPPMFEEESRLPYHVPSVTPVRITRPSVEMPAYYELWAQATGDVFWAEAAVAARAHWQATAHKTTGLTPTRADFDGKPVPGFARFLPEAYRFHVNVVLDHIWFPQPDRWHVTETNRVLGFFLGEGDYGTSYEIDGTVFNENPEPALVMVNGISASISTLPERRDLIKAVWDYEVPAGPTVYYQGLMKLLGLLILSGQYRVY